MKEELDPYKAPTIHPEPGPDQESRGRGWRIDHGRLMVQDHAQLPDVCLYGGLMGAPGRRIYLDLRAKDRRVRVVALCSDGARKARAWRRALLATVPPFSMGALAWWVCSQNGLSFSVCVSIWSVVVSFSGIAADRWVQRRDLRITPSADRWHELSGVDHAALEELNRFGVEPNDRDYP